MSSTITLEPLAVETHIKDATDFDAILFINDGTSGTHFQSNDAVLDSIRTSLVSFQKVNPSLMNEVTVVPYEAHASGRIVFAPISSLNSDIDDVRRIYDAAFDGMKKVLKLKCSRPLLVVGDLNTAPKDEPWANKRTLLLNALLGAYHALYQPIELREAHKKDRKAEKFGVYTKDKELLKVAHAMEEGRRIARDIHGSDPERMAAPKIAEYLEQEFKQHFDVISMSVEKVDVKKYPLMAAVNRAASVVPRHEGRVVKMAYIGSNVTENLFLVGKGITYDTGGADVKAGGVMAGMHRDKGGAAGIAGFMKMLALLKPDGFAVQGKMAYVRNSIGAECYVADEIITARSGQRVRVGNTDAEGRMVMTDLLCEAKEEALEVDNPSLFTWATLTGHVGLAYGSYAAVMDNGPARKKDTSIKLKAASELVSDLAEISTIRREDYDLHRGKSEYEDVLQCNNLPSSRTPRGHQTPAAFMTMASGLNEHGKDSKKPLPYTHVDVATAAGCINELPTASPAMMFAARYILPKLKIL
ncbi:Cytosol aminopeptidase, catalytic domain [Cichlidogyrus casuarinus]|uniref:Cytosol aminopeptidase, catalytic domain n=1 Tax=Cichlidogyrus casuarinus TaxID=1844966 RepID=A0ABD2QHN7_9PLAT